MNRISVGFTGTREGLTVQQKAEIVNILKQLKHITVLHGDCVGADTDFHNLCLDYNKNNSENEILIQIFPPDDDKLRAFNIAHVYMDPKPYLTRNENIVKQSDILIACPIDKNTEVLRSGTWSTIRKARKLNKPIYIF
jgi:hypothetical protein